MISVNMNILGIKAVLYFADLVTGLFTASFLYSHSS